jgi:hypothetical protein
MQGRHYKQRIRKHAVRMHHLKKHDIGKTENAGTTTRERDARAYIISTGTHSPAAICSRSGGITI